MTYQILFTTKNKKNVSKCTELKFLPRMLSVDIICVDEPIIEIKIRMSFVIFTFMHPMHILVNTGNAVVTGNLKVKKTLVQGISPLLYDKAELTCSKYFNRVQLSIY